MRVTHPLSIALIAGTLAALATFFLNAGAQDGPSIRIAESSETAIFAGGCFWCVESDFDKVDGVLATISGYTGGRTTNPTYKTHTKQGHLEAVMVEYDPNQVTYGELVNYFMRHIDPTDPGGQFCDRGNSYSTAIFVENVAERTIVEQAFADILISGALARPIVTKILPEVSFYAAETYHQDYYKKNPTRYGFYRRGCKRDETVKAVWSGK